MPTAPASLGVGTRIGPYEIVGWLGAGGMGHVYRARDTRLGRDVALKVLPEAFAGNPERLARFEREARMLAVLNHPNIAAIYGFEEAGPIRALVLEFVAGPTLAERIRDGIAVNRALLLATQIADALAAAHAQAIVHRDLKPGNVQLSGDVVKVLDFGVAKMWSVDPAPIDADASTLTSMETMAGTIVGSAAYMSPEQARGQAVDHRTDIWAFGCVLFEMLSGRSPFAGRRFRIRSRPFSNAIPTGAPCRHRFHGRFAHCCAAASKSRHRLVHPRSPLCGRTSIARSRKAPRGDVHSGLLRLS